MNDNKKRRIPRHVDGRIKVGLMTFKNFCIMLPFGISIVIFILTHPSPLTFFLGTILIGLLVAFFSEFQQNETGFDVMKSKLIYYLEGDKYFERGCLNASANKRRNRG